LTSVTRLQRGTGIFDEELMLPGPKLHYNLKDNSCSANACLWRSCSSSRHIHMYGGEHDTRCVNKFTRPMVQQFGGIYLREPIAEDIARLIEVAEQREFSWMLNSIDCMHWEWEKCPMTLHG
jgi:hypothetical protein